MWREQFDCMKNVSHAKNSKLLLEAETVKENEPNRTTNIIYYQIPN